MNALIGFLILTMIVWAVAWLIRMFGLPKE